MFAILISMLDSATLPVIEKVYQIYKPLVIINSKVEKAHRYSLAAGTEQTVLVLLELLLSASVAPKTHKSAYLVKAQSKMSILQLELRLYLELELANPTKLFQLQSDLKEVGRMLGGWLRSVS